MIKRHFIHKYLSLKFLPLRIKSNFIKKKIKKNFNQNLSQFEEIIKSKKFSTFWFLNNIHAFDYFFPKDKNKKFSFLEIGSFEGMSALYVLSNFKNCDVYCIDLWNDTHDNRKNLKYDFNKIEENFNENLKEYKFEKIIIACGAFSKKLTDNLSEKIPLDTERGYHVHFKNCDHLLSRPVIFSNRGLGITPMEQGLRVVGTVEFGGLNNSLSKSRIKNLINNAKYMLDGLPEHEDEWLGFRPSLPDFLPIIGPSKNHKNVFYCFGHHHLGWTLGPISGKIVSGMVAEENTNLNLVPYSSVRFS